MRARCHRPLNSSASGSAGPEPANGADGEIDVDVVERGQEQDDADGQRAPGDQPLLHAVSARSPSRLSACCRSAIVSMSYQSASPMSTAAHQPAAASSRMPPLSVVSPAAREAIERAEQRGEQTNMPVSSAS